jgi:hypothetical protein
VQDDRGFWVQFLARKTFLFPAVSRLALGLTQWTLEAVTSGERGTGVTLTPKVIPPITLFKEIFQVYTKMNYFDAVHPDVLITNQW